MAAITFQWEEKDLAFFRDAGPQKAVARALSKAGNDALRVLRTASKNYVRERKNIKAGRVAQALKLNFAHAATDIQDMEWSMDVSDKATPLGRYPARQLKKGVSVQVNKGYRKLVKGAFLATMKSGHTGVFVRTGKGRTPIRELYSTKITDLFKDHDMLNRVFYGQTQAKFASTFARLLPLEIAKAGK